MKPRQRACNGAEEDADGGDEARKDARALAVADAEELGNRFERGAPQGSRIEKPHDDEGDSRAERKPPRGKSERVGELRRADGRAAAYAGAGDRARDERRTRTAPIEAEGFRRVDGAGGIETAREDECDGCEHERKLCCRNFHGIGCTSSNDFCRKSLFAIICPWTAERQMILSQENPPACSFPQF